MVFGSIIALGVNAFAVVILCCLDFFYSKRTGKPASERIRERRERQNAPISKVRYLVLSIFYLAFALFSFLAIFYSREYPGWAAIIPMAYAFFSVVMFNQLQTKRKRQNKQPN